MQSRLPTVTLVLLLLCGLATYVPELGGLWLLDRQAVYDGQWWRLYTGHLVHFSTTHLLLDLLALGVAAGLLELRRRQELIVLLVIMPPAISLALLALEPGMQYYGGISGIACGVLAYLALDGIQTSGGARRFHTGILLLLAAKTIGELLGLPLHALHPVAPVVAVPLSHAAGTLGAMLLFAVMRPRPRQTGASPEHAR